MKELRIKSKALSVMDYRTVDLTEYLPKFHFDNEKHEKDLKRVQYANGKKEEAETIANGDLIRISCESAHPRYQKNDIFVIVGKGLYSMELEEKLIGAAKGNIEITVENTPVTVTVKSIVRTAVPAFTDENVKTWGIENVNTVEELKRYYFNRQIDTFRDDNEEVDMVVTILCNEVFDNSTFALDDDEYKAMQKTVDHQMQQARAYRDEMLASGETELEDDWNLDTIAQSMVLQTIQAAAIGYQILEKTDCLTNTDFYEKEVRNRAILLNLSVEEMKVQYAETDYALEYYARYFFALLDKYVGEYMKGYYSKFQKKDMYDVAIIGAGPAGLSAALTLKMHNKSIVWFGTNALSDKVERSERIANYVGFSSISGKELNKRFRAQIETANLELTDKMVTQITSSKQGFMVLADNDIYKAKTVLLAIGSVPAKGINNEQELLGRGVSYCATCDGFLYKDKTIAVFCGAKRYEHEVDYLAELAEKVYLYTAYENPEIHLPNVEYLAKPMKTVVGEKKVEGIELTDGTKLPVDGAFFLRSSVAPTTIFKGLEMDGAHIAVNRNAETNKKGCYAAGDCTGRPYQIAKAVGEGNVAAHAIVEYLSNLEN